MKKQNLYVKNFEGKKNKRFIQRMVLSLAVAVLLWMTYQLFVASMSGYFYFMMCICITLMVAILISYFIVFIKKNVDETDAMLELEKTKRYIQEIQLQKRREQLNALQNQINPHFLYNTLDTIRGLAIENHATDVANMVATLSAMFKYSMDYSNAIVTINDEMTHLCSYIKIQSMRFPNKFNFEQIMECEFKDIQQVLIPKLVLQPIIENAFSHAFKDTIEGGKITVRYIVSDVDFTIIVSDNGVGIQDDMVVSLNRLFSNNGCVQKNQLDNAQSGIALLNINARIKMYCGERFGLHISSTLGYGTDITLSLPLRGEKNEI